MTMAIPDPIPSPVNDELTIRMALNLTQQRFLHGLVEEARFHPAAAIARALEHFADQPHLAVLAASYLRTELKEA